VDVIVLPRPRDTRDILDFSGARALIDEAYELTKADLEHRRQNPTQVLTISERIKRFRQRRGA
jgi:hypothetical protein